MKRRQQRRSNFNINLNIFKILSILLVILFIFFTPTIIKKLIKIEKIECISQYGSCPEDIMASLSLKDGSDYKYLKSHIEKVLNQNVQVNNYLIQYKIPNIVKIDVSIKKPRYSVKVSDSKYYLIDKEGMVISILNESNLPSLTILDPSYKIGDTVTPAHFFALKIIEKVNYLYSIESSVLEKNSLTIKLFDGLTIIFPVEGDIDVLVGSLRLIFSRLNEGSEGIRMEDISKIDLRFKNPVLR